MIDFTFSYYHTFNIKYIYVFKSSNIATLLTININRCNFIRFIITTFTIIKSSIVIHTCSSKLIFQVGISSKNLISSYAIFLFPSILQLRLAHGPWVAWIGSDRCCGTSHHSYYRILGIIWATSFHCITLDKQALARLIPQSSTRTWFFCIFLRTKQPMRINLCALGTRRLSETERGSST